MFNENLSRADNCRGRSIRRLLAERDGERATMSERRDRIGESEGDFGQIWAIRLVVHRRW